MSASWEKKLQRAAEIADQWLSLTQPSARCYLAREFMMCLQDVAAESNRPGLLDQIECDPTPIADGKTWASRVSLNISLNSSLQTNSTKRQKTNP
jgi:hypothetical protein